MTRNLMIYRDPDTRQYVHRYGDQRGRVVVTKHIQGLSLPDLVELGLGLDLVLEEQERGQVQDAVAIAEQVAVMLLGRFTLDAEVRIDLRTLQ